MVLPAIIATVRNAALISSAILAPFGWTPSSVTSSDPTQRQQQQQLPTTSSSQQSYSITRLFQSGSSTLNDLTFGTGCWIGSLVGMVLGYWTALQFQRWRVKERLVYWKRHYYDTRPMKKDATKMGDDQDNDTNDSSKTERRPIQITKLEGIPINLLQSCDNTKNNNLQAPTKESIHAIFRNIIHPETSLASTLHSYSVELPPGAIWNIPSSRCIRLFYALEGCGSLCYDNAKRNEGATTQSNGDNIESGNNSWKDAIVNLASLVFEGSNNSSNDIEVGKSYSMEDASISQGDIFVIEPWSRDMQIMNGAINNKSNSSSKSNYLTSMLSSRNLHILCVSDIEANHKLSLAHGSSSSSTTVKNKNDDRANSLSPLSSSSPVSATDKTSLTLSMRTKGYNALSKSMDAVKNFGWRKKDDS